MPLAIILFAGIGFLRTNFSLSVDTLRETINALVGDNFTYEGAIFGYTPSLAIVDLTEKTPLREKWGLLLSHLLYIFYPGESKFLSLITYSYNFYSHFAGFVSPPYFYFWFGYLGVIFLAVLVYIYTRFYYTTFRKKEIRLPINLSIF